MKTIKDYLKEKGYTETDELTKEEFLEIVQDQVNGLLKYKLLVKCGEDLLESGFDQYHRTAKDFMDSVIKHMNELPIEKIQDMLNDISDEMRKNQKNIFYS